MSRPPARPALPVHPYAKGRRIKLKETVEACPEKPAEITGKELQTRFRVRHFPAGTQGIIRDYEKVDVTHSEHAGHASHHANPDHQYLYAMMFTVREDVEYLQRTISGSAYTAQHIHLERAANPVGRVSLKPKFSINEIVRAKQDILLGDNKNHCFVKKGSLLQIMSRAESAEGRALTDLNNVLYQVCPLISEKCDILYLTNKLPVGSFELGP